MDAVCVLVIKSNHDCYLYQHVIMKKYPYQNVIIIKTPTKVQDDDTFVRNIACPGSGTLIT